VVFAIVAMIIHTLYMSRHVHCIRVTYAVLAVVVI